jgi:hypothetical protein
MDEISLSFLFFPKYMMCFSWRRCDLLLGRYNILFLWFLQFCPRPLQLCFVHEIFSSGAIILVQTLVMSLV